MIELEKIYEDSISKDNFTIHWYYCQKIKNDDKIHNVFTIEFINE